ncbi:MAG: hypothetical protein U0441_23340 [Polyangiaceae bacterium]
MHRHPRVGLEPEHLRHIKRRDLEDDVLTSGERFAETMSDSGTLRDAVVGHGQRDKGLPVTVEQPLD